MRDGLTGHPGCGLLTGGGPETDPPAPTLLATDSATLITGFDDLVVECFSPTALVVTYADTSDLLRIARRLHGQLTATLVAEPDDAIVGPLTTILTRKAGRILWNQWPTGVSATYAQQHGGPYPASTTPGTTSVGTAALSRFVRAVAWQGFPQQLLPGELRDDQSVPAPRRVNGVHDRTHSDEDIARPPRRRLTHRGHATRVIAGGGTATVLVETGMVPVTEPITTLRLDTPAGLVCPVPAAASESEVRDQSDIPIVRRNSGVSIASMSSSAVVLRSARQIATVPSIDATTSVAVCRAMTSSAPCSRNESARIAVQSPNAAAAASREHRRRRVPRPRPPAPGIPRDNRCRQ